MKLFFKFFTLKLGVFLKKTNFLLVKGVEEEVVANWSKQDFPLILITFDSN